MNSPGLNMCLWEVFFYVQLPFLAHLACYVFSLFVNSGSFWSLTLNSNDEPMCFGGQLCVLKYTHGEPFRSEKSPHILFVLATTGLHDQTYIYI